MLVRDKNGIVLRLLNNREGKNSGDIYPSNQIFLAFDRHDLDTRFIEEMVVEVIEPLKALVRNNTRSTEYEMVMDERLDRVELERSVFTDLIVRDSRYRDQAEAWANLMLEVKTMSLSGNDPEDIATAISKRMISLAGTKGVWEFRLSLPAIKVGNKCNSCEYFTTTK